MEAWGFRQATSGDYVLAPVQEGSAVLLGGRVPEASKPPAPLGPETVYRNDARGPEPRQATGHQRDTTDGKKKKKGKAKSTASLGNPSSSLLMKNFTFSKAVLAPTPSDPHDEIRRGDHQDQGILRRTGKGLHSKAKKVHFSQETTFGDPDAKVKASKYGRSAVKLSAGSTRRKKEQWLSAIRALWSAECMAAEAGNGRSWAFAVSCKGSGLYWFNTSEPTGEAEPKSEPWARLLHPSGLPPNAKGLELEKHRGVCWLFTYDLLNDKGDSVSEFVHQQMLKHQEEAKKAVPKALLIIAATDSKPKGKGKHLTMFMS